MGRTQEPWEIDNFFCSQTEHDIFFDYILSKISRDYKEYCKKKGNPYTEETLISGMSDIVEDLASAVEYFVYEEFENQED